MCGIFGIVTTKDSPLSPRRLRSTMNDLFRLSESRGKEAAGVAFLSSDAIHIYKEAVPASTMVRRCEYDNLFQQTVGNGPSPKHGHLGTPITIIGHSRLVTTGLQQNRLNNQPVINRGAVGIHNGIIVNDEALWKRFPAMQRHGQVDSEVIVSLIRQFLAEKKSLIEAVQETFRLIQGAASIAVLFDDLDYMVLATNNGSLYMASDPQGKTLVFASEKHILRELAKKHRTSQLLTEDNIIQIEPRHGFLVHLRDLSQQHFPLPLQALPEVARNDVPLEAKGPPRKVIDIEPSSKYGKHNGQPRTHDTSSQPFRFDPPAHFDHSQAIASLRRCTKCILPETMPFIEFDSDGVCNYCRNFKRIDVYGKDALEELVAPYRSKSNEPDCLVGLSGGRDSTYGLHYIKTVLKMNPIAYTYDWGMVTDLARRNISRICGKLGVEHILVSANIERKRRHIHKNVAAWLKRPDLGIIPLFMAGDKQYFYHAKKLKKQTGVPLIMLCENMLEKTDFKSGFAGVRPSNIDEDHVYTLPIVSKLAMIGHYGREYLLNPAYLNTSVPDTLFAYACYYLISRDYLNLFRFVEWKEEELIGTLREEYDWELATDTESTWRIGDGTASFYNYIYYTVAGFSENETFRSNQIRQGVITKERALELAARDNQPRWESIKWYLDTIGLGQDFEAIVNRINEIPKRYSSS